MRRRRRVDVLEREADVVLVHHLARDLLRQDLVEERARRVVARAGVEQRRPPVVAPALARLLPRVEPAAQLVEHAHPLGVDRGHVRPPREQPARARRGRRVERRGVRVPTRHRGSTASSNFGSIWTTKATVGKKVASASENACARRGLTASPGRRAARARRGRAELAQRGRARREAAKRRRRLVQKQPWIGPTYASCSRQMSSARVRPASVDGTRLRPGVGVLVEHVAADRVGLVHGDALVLVDEQRHLALRIERLVLVGDEPAEVARLGDRDLRLEALLVEEQTHTGAVVGHRHVVERGHLHIACGVQVFACCAT